MRAFKPLAIAILAAAVVLAVPGVALANGGHLHFGATMIPLVAVYGAGGFVGVVVLFFLANWARYRRSQSRGGPSPVSEESQTRDEEGHNDTRG